MEEIKFTLSRRDFVRSVATVGAGAVLSSSVMGQEAAKEEKPQETPKTTPKPDDLKVAIIGAGSQGNNLVNNALKIEGIRFVAVCDIWAFNLNRQVKILKKFDHEAKPYADYQDMLATEKDLDAVIVASPDWVHAEHSIACMKAGLHVYCEKEMSNDLAKAKEMVLASRETKKLLQIGHQRRSNPRYHHALKMITKDKILGRITHCNGQWNRGTSQSDEIGWAKGADMDEASLKKYGYDTMQRFRNWRWFRQYSGGLIADLGSHQIDIYNWFLMTPPKTVIASGGLDYYKGREWYDNVLTIYEYATEAGPVRAYYQVLNTSSFGNLYETFLGDEGTMQISEDDTIGKIIKEPRAKKREWEDDSAELDKMGRSEISLKVGETLKAGGKKDAVVEQMVANLSKPPHQVHLENFFNAIRNGTPLSCPGEVGYETAVTVLAANDSIAKKGMVEFNPEQFKV
ncbi:MAG TPA: Gfo/Idh/MocA family oxidoreductase [Candidatus Brocadiia bacterium]|nr:Gfo/Idh/MocA family oxidoreductase [Candidatus Brocadiia bacterium]